MDLERELRQALTRKSPPRGFDEKVLGRIASGEQVEAPVQPARWAGYVLPLAASLALVAGGSYYLWQQERQQRETERTARNVVLALQIASDKVSAVQTKVQEISRYERQIQ
jgi:hypothetical protein